MQTRSWNDLHAFILLAASGVAFAFNRIDVVVYATLFSFLLLINARKKEIVSLANGITISRLVLLALVILNATKFTANQLFVLLGIAVLMDVLDGYVARKTNSSSQLGFILDLEVDAFFVLVMSFYFYQLESVPLWVLLPGLMRYLFKLVTYLYPKPDFKESKKWYASSIAGSYFVLLLVSILVSGEARTIILFIGGLFIVISFGISFIEYFRWTRR